MPLSPRIGFGPLQALALQQPTILYRDDILHWLYIIAAVLALLLIAVVWLAIKAWRKNNESDLRG